LTNNYTNEYAITILNDTVLGADACQETKYCNDSLVTYLNDTPIFYYNDEYNATSDWRLFVNASHLNTDYNMTIYFYYNNSNHSRNSFFDGNKVFRGFESFQNYTDGVAPSGHFGGITSPANLNITSTGCFDVYCLYHNAGGANGDIIYGFDNVENAGIIDVRIKSVDGGNSGTYLGTTLCNGAYPCGWAGSTGNIYPVTSIANVWQKFTMIWRNGNVNVTLDGSLVANVAFSGNIGETAFGYVANQFYADNLIWRDVIEEPQQTYIGAIENVPPVIDNFTIITQVFPLNATTNTTNDILLGYFVNASDTTISCSLLVNGTLSQTNTSALNGSLNTFPLSALGNETYTWSVNCTIPGLTNETGNWTFTIAKAYPVTPPSIISGICAISADNEIHTATNFYFSVSPVSLGDIVSYIIYDQYGNVFFSSENFTGREPIYIFQQYSPSKAGTYFISVQCNTSLTTKTLIVVKPKIITKITESSLLNTGFPLKLFLYMIGVAACIIVGSRVRIPLVWLCLAGLLIYIGFSLFIGGNL